MASLIEDYALIGDGHTAALVARDGSIDWLCWPRFDSGACFAALLGSEANGRWQIAPASSETVQISTTRCYRAGTLILETTFESAHGAVTLTDFMPMREGGPQLIRIVQGVRGTMAIQMELAPRFDYGTAVPWISRLADDSGLQAVAGPDMVVLRTPTELQHQQQTIHAQFSIEVGQQLPFVLTYAPSHLPPPPAIDAGAKLADTERYWRQWCKRSSIRGKYATSIQRSLLTLKALTYAPSGGIVAAPTTSLPEQLGGTRNWDYRFCWLRDATITLTAMMRGGYYEEAHAWRNWLSRAVTGDPGQLQIMYGINGERRLPEIECDWLDGYENSKPVRLGNGAAHQLQLDVYGELMNALYVARVGGLQADATSWTLQRALMRHLADIWEQPDEGIWEVRGGKQQFTFSKIMAWVAFDRAIKSAEQFHLSAPLEQWHALRDQIHADVCARAFNTELNTFVQQYGGSDLDASLLLISATGFLPADDPRVRGTVTAIEKNLTRDGLVLRYHSSKMKDGLPAGEGAFLACSFWLVDNLILQERWEEATERFERLLALCNDVGLLAEEYDPQTGRLLGNFPQAFSHVALINTGLNLMQHEEGTRKAAGGRSA